MFVSKVRRILGQLSVRLHQFQLLIASKRISVKISYFPWFYYVLLPPLFGIMVWHFHGEIASISWEMNDWQTNKLGYMYTEYYWLRKIGENCEKFSNECSMCFDHLTATNLCFCSSDFSAFWCLCVCVCVTVGSVYVHLLWESSRT